MEQQEQPPLCLKARALVSAMLVNFLIGTYYAFSNANPYIAAHMKKKPGDTIITMQIWSLMQSIFTAVGCKLAARIGPWKTNLIGFAGYTLVQLVASWIKDYVTFIAVYGVLCGVFIGLAYVQALYISWTYFPKQKSAVTGIILFCAGISASVLSPLTTAIVNPDNLPNTHADYGKRVPLLFRTYAIIYGVIALTGCLLQPASWESQHLKERKEAEQISKHKSYVDEEHRAVVEEVISRHHSVRLRAGETQHVDSGDINELHKDELAAEVHHFGGGEHAMVLSKNLTHGNLSDLVMPRMKYHRVVASRHAHLSKWRKHHPHHKKHRHVVHKSSSNGSTHQDSSTPATEASSSPTKQDSGHITVIEHDTEAIMKQLAETKRSRPKSMREAICSRSFWMVVLMAFCGAIFNYFLNSNWKDYYSDILRKRGTTDSQLSLMLTFGALANSFIRVFVGFALMKVHMRYLYLLLATFSIFSAFSFLDLMQSYATGVLFIMLAMACIGIQTTLFPTVCTKLFGSKIGALVYPYVYLSFSVANFAQYFLYRFYGKASDKPQTMFYLFGALACIGLVASVFMNFEPKWSGANESAQPPARVQQSTQPRDAQETERNQINTALEMHGDTPQLAHPMPDPRE